MRKLTDRSIMRFGKHKGKKMIDVPADYLIFIYENNKCTPEVAMYVKDNIDVLNYELKK